MLANQLEKSVTLLKLSPLKSSEVAPELLKALTYSLKKSTGMFLAPVRFTFLTLSPPYKNVLVNVSGNVTLLKSRLVKAPSP